MKRFLMIAVMLLPLIVIAQGNYPIDKLFDKYGEKTGFKRVDISGKLFASMRSNDLNLTPAVIVPQLDEFYKKQFSTLQKISGISILSLEDKGSAQNKSVDFYKELEEEGFFKNNSYEVLMEVTGKSDVHFYGRNAPDGKYSELLMVIGGYEKKVISIRGIIDPMEIGQITRALDVDINRYSK